MLHVQARADPGIGPEARPCDPRFDASCDLNIKANCEKASGLLNDAYFCICPALHKRIIPSDPDDANDCRNENQKKLERELERSRNSKACASDCSCEANSNQYSCPHDLLGFLLADDQTKGWVLNPWAIDPSERLCPNPVANGISAEALEKFYATTPGFRVGAPTDTITQSCFRPNGPAAESDRKHAIAKYYYLMNRVKQSELSTIQEIADADSSLGKETFKTGRCVDPHFSETTTYCSRLSHCGSTGAVAMEAKEVADALQDIAGAQARINAIAPLSKYQNLRTGSQSVTYRPEDQRRIDQLNGYIDDVKAQNPRLADETYLQETAEIYRKKGVHVLNEDEVGSAIRGEIGKVRKGLQSRLDQLRQASDCLNSDFFDSKRCQNIIGAITNISSPPSVPPMPAHSSQMDGEARMYMYSTDCRFEVNEDKHRSDSIAMAAESSIGTLVAWPIAEYFLTPIIAPIFAESSVGALTKQSVLLTRAAEIFDKLAPYRTTAGMLGRARMIYTFHKLSENLKKAYAECKQQPQDPTQDISSFSNGPVCAADLEQVIGPTILAKHHSCVSEILKRSTAN